MTAKLTLTIEPMDTRPPKEHMSIALAALASLEIPTAKTAVQFVFADEEAMHEMRDRIYEAFAHVPLTVSVSVKALDEGEVPRTQSMTMEELWDRR